MHHVGLLWVLYTILGLNVELVGTIDPESTMGISMEES